MLLLWPFDIKTGDDVEHDEKKSSQETFSLIDMFSPCFCYSWNSYEIQRLNRLVELKFDMNFSHFKFARVDCTINTKNRPPVARTWM